MQTIVQTILHDLRYSARQLLRHTSFTVAAVLTIALGIGVNVALFSVVGELLLRPRPGVNDASALVWITPWHKQGYKRRLAYPDFNELRDRLAPLAELAASDDDSFALGGGGPPELIKGQIATSNYFSVLHAPVALGRTFSAGDDQPTAASIAIINYALWKSRFGGDSSIIGRELHLNGQPVIVVGVAAEHFNGADQSDDFRQVWVTLLTATRLSPGLSKVINDRNFTTLTAVGRLGSGISAGQLQTLVTSGNAQFVSADSANRAEFALRVFSAATGFPPGSERQVVSLALAATTVTGLILLIAFSNVSNLLLARGVSRRREIAIRLSLGASRSRLIRQLITENLLLTLVGGLFGVLLATWCVELVLKYALPLPITIHFDWRVMMFTGVATTTTGLAFGLIPAFDATRASLSSATNIAERKQRSIQDKFVVAQVALAVTLLVMSGLFLRSVTKAQAIDLGFDASPNIIALQFNLGLQGYSTEKSDQFLNSLMEDAARHASVTSTSLTTILPTTMFMQTRVVHGNAAVDSGVKGLPISVAAVRPAYFRTVGIGMLQGRDFTAQDTRGSLDVAIVSEKLAKRLWPGKNPVGERLAATDSRSRVRTVVGVVSDVVVSDVQSGKSAMIYFPQLQQPASTLFTVLVRTSGNPAALILQLRADLHSLDADVPVARLETLEDVRASSTQLQRHGSTVLGIFGALALLLAAIGVNGVMAFAVVQRTREIGVRMALGAEPLRVVRMIVSRGMKLTGIGTAIGLCLSLGLGRALSSMLFGISPGDVASYAGGSVVLFAAALLACWLPARRAAGISPIIALRQEQ